MKLFWATFLAIFLAELGDKTQLATLVFAARSENRLIIFFASALALVFASALGVLAGKLLGDHLSLRYVRLIGGGLFILLGIAMLLGKL
ncbi:MAG: TMEM165/GDT1 family protein [Thermodesulfobacteria bacterium]|nr:TMEM165/GDT1 family protein [Thermodesulfobacteriota bacterium]